MQVERVALDTVVPDPANVRLHSDTNLDAIKGSLARFGQQKPIVVDHAGVIRAGNGTYAAAQALGWDSIQVVRTDLEGLEATAFAIADNRTSDLSEFDSPALARLLSELREEDALAGVGFSDADLDALLADLSQGLDLETELDDPGPGEPPDEPVSRDGDLWVLGDHRLLCGDSTSLEAVQRVMGDEQAKLVATDPPYLVDYTGERPNDSGKDWSATYREIDITDGGGVLPVGLYQPPRRPGAPRSDLLLARPQAGRAAHPDVGGAGNHRPPAGRCGSNQRLCSAACFGTSGMSPAAWVGEQGSKPEHDGNHEFDSVWEVDYDGLGRRAADHPTAEARSSCSRGPMRKHTKPGDLVFEPFSGSGSQIIAAEKLGRRCHAIEISPAFVDVAVGRWEGATGKQATLDGATFEQVARER